MGKIGVPFTTNPPEFTANVLPSGRVAGGMPGMGEGGAGGGLNCILKGPGGGWRGRVELTHPEDGHVGFSPRTPIQQELEGAQLYPGRHHCQVSQEVVLEQQAAAQLAGSVAVGAACMPDTSVPLRSLVNPQVSFPCVDNITRDKRRRGERRDIEAHSGRGGDTRHTSKLGWVSTSKKRVPRVVIVPESK